MIGIGDFELYLMSQMSAAHLVQRALVQRGLSEAQMKSTALRVVEQCELRDGTPHSTYHDLLKSVLLTEAPTPDIPPSSSFAGSVSYFYRLPEWHDTPLQIIRAPRGHAWGISFVQDPGTLNSALTQRQIKPWKFALDGVRALFAWQEDDTWSDYQRDLYQQAPTAGRMRGTFDFGLLQDWREDVTKPLPEWQVPTTPLLTSLGWPRRP
jgi:hypothetical protein